MKEIEDYFVPVTIYLVPHLRNGNSLRIEINPLCSWSLQDYYGPLIKKLRDLGFSCSEEKSVFNHTEIPNIIDIALPLYLDEKEFIPELIAHIQEGLGENSVLDRTRSTIKKENNKMKT